MKAVHFNFLLGFLLVFFLIGCLENPMQEPELPETPIIGSIEGLRNGEKWNANINYFEFENDKQSLALIASMPDLIDRRKERISISFIPRNFEKHTVRKRDFAQEDFNELSILFRKIDYDVIECTYDVNEEKVNNFQFTSFDRDKNTISGEIHVEMLFRDGSKDDCKLPNQLIFEDLKFTVKADPSWFDLD